MSINLFIIYIKLFNDFLVFWGIFIGNYVFEVKILILQFVYNYVVFVLILISLFITFFDELNYFCEIEKTLNFIESTIYSIDSNRVQKEYELRHF